MRRGGGLEGVQGRNGRDSLVIESAKSMFLIAGRCVLIAMGRGGQGLEGQQLFQRQPCAGTVADRSGEGLGGSGWSG